jgi:hypothetical protein
MPPLGNGDHDQDHAQPREEFLYELKAGPAGGRLRRPSSAGRPDAAVSRYGHAANGT